MVLSVQSAIKKPSVGWEIVVRDAGLQKKNGSRKAEKPFVNNLASIVSASNKWYHGYV
jgi:hypothetical protein